MLKDEIKIKKLKRKTKKKNIILVNSVILGGVE
jgi:hypothetical protein